MYSTDSRATRILAQPGIDYVEALEAELGRPIILTGGRGQWGAAADLANLARERFPEAEDPLVLVIRGSIAYTPFSTWWYVPTLDQRSGLLNPDAESAYYLHGDFMAHRRPEEIEHLYFTTTIDPDSNSGNPVTYAEAIEGVAAIGFRLDGPEYNDEWAKFNWEVLLGEPLRAAASDDIATLMEELRASRLERTFQAFVTQGRDRALAGVRQTISRETQNLTGYQERITQAMRTLADLNKQLASLEATLEDGVDIWTRRFEELCAHSKLTDVDFQNEAFILTTDHLRMTHPTTGDSRWLGRVKITVPISNTMFGIRFENLDNPKAHRAHPHVEGNGPDSGPCFGAISSTVSQLHSSMELMALTDVLIMFLESFNPRDDWGSYAAYWFDVEDADPRPEFNPNIETADEAEAVPA